MQKTNDRVSVPSQQHEGGVESSSVHQMSMLDTISPNKHATIEQSSLRKNMIPPSSQPHTAQKNQD